MYTDGKSSEQASVVLVTYPRAGNTLMRKQFENLSGVATGSDVVMKFQPNMALQFMGFKAEGITDDRVWIKKSHYPFTTPFQPGFQGDYGLVCIRNPLNCVPSFFFLASSCTHTESYVPCLLREDVVDVWKEFFHKAIDAWVEWHNYWLAEARAGKPVYFFGFEDILVDPKRSLRELMGFVLGMTEKDMDGSVMEQRIEEVIAMGASSS